MRGRLQRAAHLALLPFLGVHPDGLVVSCRQTGEMVYTMGVEIISLMPGEVKSATGWHGFLNRCAKSTRVAEEWTCVDLAKEWTWKHIWLSHSRRRQSCEGVKELISIQVLYRHQWVKTECWFNGLFQFWGYIFFQVFLRIHLRF